MKKRRILYFTALLFLLSCNRKEKEIKKYFETAPNKKTESIVVQDQYIEDENLLSEMESQLYNYSKSQKFIIKKELVNNKHVDDLIDTIKIFRLDKVNIKSHKTGSEEWIFEAKIQNTEFAFSKFIKIGIDKKVFEKIVKIKVNSNTVKIGNLEQTSVFIFKFKNNILQEIEFEGYVD